MRATLLTGQLASLQRELARAREDILPLLQEREFMLSEMRMLNAELQLSSAPASPPQRSSREWAPLFQQGDQGRATARHLCTWAQQIRLASALHRQRQHEMVLRLLVQTRRITSWSTALLPPTLSPQETP